MAVQSTDKIQGLFSESLQNTLLELRRSLHRHPELSFKEERTAETLEKALTEIGVTDIRRVARTGIVARVPGKNTDAPVVAIRGDIDALPIHEDTELDYSSEIDGVMHACGHDVHATWTVAAAALLLNDPAEGDVLILLQPAEETGKGAPAILESGALDEVSAIFGAHVDRRFPVGEVVVQEGSVNASADVFTIELKGQGAHGARPHEAVDPVVGAGALINAIQTIVSRRINPAHPGVISIGSIHGGSAPNVIPDTVTLTGTIRATEPEIRQQLQDELMKITEQMAKAYGLESTCKIDDITPPINNKPGPLGWARKAVAATLGNEAAVPLGFLNMGAEDFAYYLETISGCFLRVGAREAGGEVIPAHSPQFYAADEAIFTGAAVLAETARIASADIAHSES